MWFDTHCHLDFAEFTSHRQAYNALFAEHEIARFLYLVLGLIIGRMCCNLKNSVIIK